MVGEVPGVHPWISEQIEGEFTPEFQGRLERTLGTAADAVLPLVWQDVYEAYQQEGFGPAATSAGLNFFGVGTNTYGPRESDIRREAKWMIQEGNLIGARNLVFEWNINNVDPQKKIDYDRLEKKILFPEEEE